MAELTCTNNGNTSMRGAQIAQSRQGEFKGRAFKGIFLPLKEIITLLSPLREHRQYETKEVVLSTNIHEMGWVSRLGSDSRECKETECLRKSELHPPARIRVYSGNKRGGPNKASSHPTSLDSNRAMPCDAGALSNLILFDQASLSVYLLE